MADTAGLTPFGPDDRFLRRIRFPDHLKRGIVYWRAFKEKDDVPTLSYTYQDASLRSDPALDAYREYFSRALGGDLPGLLWLSWRALAQQVRPPLPPATILMPQTRCTAISTVSRTRRAIRFGWSYLQN
jgi:hypothetical protein